MAPAKQQNSNSSNMERMDSKEKETKSELEDEGQAESESVSEMHQGEVLDELVEQTKLAMGREADLGFEALVEFVRTNRLPSKFSYENLSELVKFLLEKTRLPDLPIEFDECVTFVSSTIYDDPITHVKAAEMWDCIIDQIQNRDD